MSFEEFLIGKNVVRKMIEYGRILEEESGYPREYSAYMVKSKNQKDDVITDMIVPYHDKASASHYYVSPSSYADAIFKIDSLQKHLLGRFHYHGIYAAQPSPEDMEERKFILAETMINNKIFIDGKGGIMVGRFLNAKIEDNDNIEKISVETNNPYLGKVELIMRRKKQLPMPKFLHRLIKYSLEKIDHNFIDVEDFKGRIDFLITRPIVYGYGYNFILNKKNEMYAEIIYQRIEFSGPVNELKFKPLKVRLVDHPNDVQFTEKDLRNDIIEKFKF